MQFIANQSTTLFKLILAYTAHLDFLQKIFLKISFKLRYIRFYIILILKSTLCYLISEFRCKLNKMQISVSLK